MCERKKKMRVIRDLRKMQRQRLRRKERKAGDATSEIPLLLFLFF